MEIPLNGSDWKFKHFWPEIGRWSGWKMDPTDWANAEVPGCAQRDMLRIGQIADPYMDFNSRDAEWISNKEWGYVKDFDAPEAARGKRVRLRFEGVDYFADYYFNGEHLGESGNLFIPIEFDVTDKIKFGEPNRLIVILHPAPPEQAQMGRTSKVWTMKPRFAYQWDFSTTLVPIGIWQDVKLLVNDDSRLTDFWVRAIPSDDFKKGLARVEVEIESASEAKAEVSVELSFGGKQVGAAQRQLELEPGSNTVRFNIRVADIQLWWPNGCGEQNLYEGSVALKDTSGKVIDERTVTFGFKRVRLIPNQGVPEDSHPFSLEVNGRRTFVKGWNWVPIDHMYGGVPDAKYERLLTLVRDANCNLIRIWGGGLIEKEVFYSACDKLGLMVWQEFTLSSSANDSLPSTKPEYVNMLREAAKKIVPLRRNHASHSIWCGGNELKWTGKEDAAMSAMHKVCASLDPDKPFLPTSPLRIEQEGESPYCDYHGSWTYEGVEDHYKKYDGLKTIFHSEVGTEGAANLESIPRFIRTPSFGRRTNRTNFGRITASGGFTTTSWPRYSATSPISRCLCV
jgi:beta-mannosidase